MKIVIHKEQRQVGITTLSRSILEYLFVICIILDGNSVWMNIQTTRNWFGTILQFLIMIIMIALLLTYSFKKSCLKNACLILGFGITYLLILGLVHPNNKKGLIGFAVISMTIIAFVYLYKSIGRVINILDIYEQIIIAVAVISVFFWLFGSVLKIIPASGYELYNWTGNGLDKQINKYWGLYYETQWTYLQGYGVFTRNTAIFTEAPMCSLHFSIALLIEVFIKEELDFRKYVTLILAILTTFSTTGYLIVVVTVFFKIVYSKKNNQILQYIKVIVVPASLIVGLIASMVLLQLKMNSSSGVVRMDDFIAGYKAWMENPIFGCGFGNYDALIKYMSVWRQNNTGFSNSIMEVLAYGGVYFGMIYMMPFIKGIYSAVRLKRYRMCIFVGSILFLFIFTVVPFRFLTILLLGYIGLLGREREDNNKA